MTTPAPAVDDRKLAALEKLARRALAREARAEAIAAYERAAALAVSMGEEQRTCPVERLRAFSRTEIEHMTAGLYASLDKVAAGVPGYARKVQTVTDQPAPTA